MTSPSWSGKRWQCRCCERAWWPSPSPQPPSAPALRERKGEYATTPSPLAPFLSSTGSGRGGSRRSSDPAPASYNDGASIRSPLSRRAGEGLGVRAAPPLPPSPLPLSYGERTRGSARRCGDPAPASVNDTEATNQFPPLPPRGRGAGGEGGPSPSPQPPFLSPTKRGRENVGAGEKERWKPEFDPILSERWETWGLARKNAGNPSRHSHTGTVRAQ